MSENKINTRTLLDVGDAIREADRRSMVPPGCEPAGPGAISAWVAGTPAPQGSKRALGAGRPGGKIRMVEMSKTLPGWRADVRQAFLGEDGFPMPVEFPKDQPVVVKIVFVMPRTKAMRNRPSGDFPMTQKPDTDKLVRAVLDALTSAGVYADDGQAVGVHAFKRRAEPGESTGAMIHVELFLGASLPSVARPNVES